MTVQKKNISSTAQDLWRRVQSNFQNEALQQEFLDYCIQNRLFEFAASCYKEQLKILPDDALTKAMQTQLADKMFAIMKAELTMLPDTSKPGEPKVSNLLLSPSRPQRLTKIIVSLLGGVAILLLVYFAYARSNPKVIWGLCAFAAVIYLLKDLISERK